MTKTKLIKDKEPDYCQMEVVGESKTGDLLAKPVDRGLGLAKKMIFIQDNPRICPALAMGDVFMGRIFYKGDNCNVKPILRMKTADQPVEKLYGLVERRGRKCFIVTSEKSRHMDYLLDHPGNNRDGDFISFYLSGDKKYKTVTVIKNFGKFDLSKAASSLVLEKYEIPAEFSSKARHTLSRLPEFDAECRSDLCSLPFVTIDGDDSKDFDDAVWAEKTADGFKLGVAIADVGFYVRPGSLLDREAYQRGNSIYLPNMVIPMLPELLSNDLCSLRPKEKRPALVCFMEIDLNGKLKKYHFERAIIRSAARLTYKEVQEALDGKRSANAAPVYKSTILPIYEAFQLLEKARKKRGTLELETTELKIKFDKSGHVSAVEKAVLYTSNKIIEEFMVAANVAAALQLGKSKLPVMYRIHDRPPAEKLKDMQPLLEKLKMKLPDAPALKPTHFNKVIEKCQAENLAAGVSDLVLRMQSQAQYSPDNIGHFGLGLKNYVHFTSPIRRYADLLIHRALIRACKLPEGGELEEGADHEQFVETGTHLGDTERRAVSAEREMTARFLSEYLQPSIGMEYEVKITGMTTAGLFVRIENLGAEGLMPMRLLPAGRYELDDCRSKLECSKNGLKFCFGDLIKAKLEEASPITGGLVFSLAGDYCLREDSHGGKENRKTRKQRIKKHNQRKGKKCQKPEVQ